MIKAVALQPREAMESGRHQKRSLIHEIRRVVDRHVQFSRRRLRLASTLVILAVLVIEGTSGSLRAATARNWAMAALLIDLMIVGVFVLDQVRLMQRRDDSLKTGMYVAAANQEVPAAANPRRTAPRHEVSTPHA